MNIQNAKLEQRALQVESQLSSHTQADSRSQVSSQLNHYGGAAAHDPCKKCESLLIAQGLTMQQLAKLKAQNCKLK